MARNHKFYFDKDGSPKARGPASEKMLMSFLETDVQGSDHICRELMDDLTAIEDGSDDSREFIGNAHRIVITPQGVTMSTNLNGDDSDSETSSDTTKASTTVDTPGTSMPSPASSNTAGATATHYQIALKHFREVLEDWEAFILDDQLDDPLAVDDYL